MIVGMNQSVLLINYILLLHLFCKVLACACLKGEVAKLSNENLVVLAGVLKGISDKYIKADGAPGAAPAIGGETPDSMRAKARELMASPAYSNPMDPNHDGVMKQIDELYRRATAGK